MTEWKMSRRLIFRTTLPLVFVILVMAVTLYVFNLRLISTFASSQIELSLSALSHEIYQVCDRNFSELLEKGLLEDAKSVRISKANTLGLIEDFLRNNHLSGQILDQQGTRLFPETLPAKLLIKALHQQNSSGISEIHYKKREYYLTQTRFRPWGWRIFILKDASAFANLIREVRKVYILTGIILLLAGILLLYNINRAVKIPLMGIIDDVNMGKNPEYKGIIEFEFLSNSIRQMMADLKESEQTVRNIAAGLGEGVYVIDRAGRLLFMNPEAERLLGWQESELLGQDIHEVFHHHRSDQGLLPRDECPVLQIVRSGETYRTEDDFFTSKNGAVLPVSYVATPLKKDGIIVGAVTAFQDITERKRAEEALRKSAEEIYDLYNRAPCGYHSLDADGVFVQINETELQWLGYARDEIVGKKRFIEVISARSSETFNDNFSRFKVRGWVRDLEFEMVRKDGTILPVLLSASAVTDPDGNFVMSRATIYDLSERQRAEAALRESEAQYHAIVEGFDGLIYVCSQDYRVEFMNDKLISRTGYDATGELCYQALHDRDSICPWCVNDQVLKGETVRWELNSPKDGRWYYIVNTPIYHSDGTMSKQAMIQDITERKRAEDELRKLNRTLAMLSDCNQSVIRAKDEVSLLQEVCRIIVEVGGYYMAWVGFPEEDEDKTVRPVAFAGHEDGYLQAVKISWADNELGQGPVGRAIRTGEPAFVENISTDPSYSAWRDEATRRHYGASISIPLIINEQTQGALNLYVAQPSAFASEEVKLLMELGGDLAYGLEALRNREECQKVEEAFENLVRSAPMGIFIASENKFKLVNPGFLKITGYDEQELLDQDPLALAAPEFEEKARANALQMLKGERLTPFEFQFLDKEGKRRWVMETLTQTQYRGERVVLGYFMEVTEKKHLEKQLLHAQKMEAVGRLAGGLAHDFSNLLAVIIWSVQRMMSEFDQAHPMYQHLEGIKTSTDQAIMLTRQLLAFSRKQMVLPRVVNLNCVISEMEHMMRRLIGEDVELLTVLDPALKAVKADPARIEQVVMNLVVNARDAMPWGGKLTIETGNVSLDLSYAQTHFEVEPGPYVMLAVSDTGLGMDPETQSHIFEPFYTTKEADKGTGLGLSIVYGIIKQIGGNIAVCSELGHGTTFKIYLPQVEEALKPGKARVIPTTQLHGSETILLVEDENLVRNLIAGTLKKYGYTVLSAGQGSEALQLAENFPGPIHLLLADMVMPQMSGRDLAERLVASRPEAKVLFMSGYTEQAVLYRQTPEKDTQFIQKPFTPQDLLGKVRELLDLASDK